MTAEATWAVRLRRSSGLVLVELRCAATDQSGTGITGVGTDGTVADCRALQGEAGDRSCAIWSNTRISSEQWYRSGSHDDAPQAGASETTAAPKDWTWNGGKVVRSAGCATAGRERSRCFRCRWSRRCAPPTKSSSCCRSPPASATPPAGSCSTTSRAVELWGRAPEPGQTHDQFTAQYQFFGVEGERLPRSKLAEVLQTGRRIRDEEVTVQRADGTDIAVLLNIDPLFNAAGQADRRHQLLPGRHRAQAHGRCARPQPAGPARAGGALGRHLRARRHRHRRAGCRRPVPARQRGDLLDRRRRPARSCWAGGCSGRTHPDDRDVDDELYRRQVAGDIGFYSIEKRFIRRDGRMIWIAVRSSTVRDVAGHFLYGVRVVQDVTERKEAEERQKLLIDELNHRVKNTLATVQSLATQTARGTDSPEAFRQAFEGRLIALSQAHDQLTRRHWKSADLRDIVEGATAPHLTRSQERRSDRIEGEADHGDAARRADLGAGAARADHQRRRSTARCRCRRAASRCAGGSSAAAEAADAADRMARARRAAGDGAGAAGLRLALHRGQRRHRAQGIGQAGFEPDGLVCTMEIPLDAAKSQAADDIERAIH